jgi:PAT family beta-lactamase induction signal transducer AmpG
MAIGLAATVLAPEADAGPAPSSAPSSSARHGLAAWLSSAVIGPFADFLQRYRWHAVLVLALISTYRIPDIVMGVMANPFYHDMGFSKDEVAAVSKVYGVVMTLAGAFAGGALAPRIGIQRVLFGAAAAASASIMMFAWLATRGHDLPLLVAAVSADNFVAGVAGSVFIAYLSGLTNVRYSATQYALFSSLMLLLPKFVAGFSGVAVERFGYSGFFVGAALLGLPVLLLVWLTGRYGMPAR